MVAVQSCEALGKMGIWIASFIILPRKHYVVSSVYPLEVSH